MFMELKKRVLPDGSMEEYVYFNKSDWGVWLHQLVIVIVAVISGFSLALYF